MNGFKNISIEDYNYDLPEEKIAAFPVEKRDHSRLLVYNEKLSQDYFYNISKYLPGNHLLIYNNTKVIQARILFHKETGAHIEIFCLEPHAPSDYYLAFQKRESCEWKCIVGNSKKWKEGKLTCQYEMYGKNYSFHAERVKKIGNESIIRFFWDDPFSFGEILEVLGKTPIPPYIKRASQEIDKERYQTVYSRHKGSVAAPTAGLHFTDQILDTLHKKQIQTEEVTLHVGAGTFQPVKSQNILDHTMHMEHFSVSLDAIENITRNLNQIIAVGTTTVRTIESLYWFGVKVIRKQIQELPEMEQWYPYENDVDISASDSLNALIKHMKENDLETFEATTEIIIVPGYSYRIPDHIITNFHQPRSTLLLLVAAAIGDKWKKAYAFALENKFRFLSYGDSCLFMNINKKSRT